ncbi:MAG: hypothetical protein GEU78_06000 [Actinobacteria bacterium]|nr:hypothetical protein [Actinomycetota bacterium]
MSSRRLMKMAWGALGLGLALVAPACSFGSESAATILVDYEHDTFATQFNRYFPDRVRVHPGDTITFRQTWTGEPHTVTLGALVNDVLEVTKPLIEEYGHLPDEEIPPKVFEEFFAAEGQLPTAFGDEGPPEGEGPPEEGAGPEGEAAEGAAGAEEAPDAEGEDESERRLPGTVAQPCVIEQGGEIPEDGGLCEERELPEFEGTELYFNSGIIPFEGPRGNVFDLKIAEDIEPGAYQFLCSVHGSFQNGTLEVVSEDESAPSPDEVNQATREQVNEVVRPLDKLFRDAQDGRLVLGGETHTGNFSGLTEGFTSGLVNEFVPKRIETSVEEPVTWRMFGPHTISFDVPEYFPIVEFLDDGTARFNEELEPPAGGAPEAPEPEDPSKPMVIDGGTYDGSGFWSSGLFFADPYVEYTLRFSTPGTYRYACLIHPPMVGTLVVKE